MIWRPILAVALLVTALGLIFESIVPASARIIDIGAAVCGLATWTVPLLMLAVSWNQRPRSSLAGVSFAIRIFVVAACLSAIGLSLALLTLVFAQGANWAWLALLAIAAFWLSGGVLIYVAGRRSPRAGERSK
jgi:hypothetical protein